MFFVFQPGFVAFVAFVALPCFTMLYHALPIYQSINQTIYLSILSYLIYFSSNLILSYPILSYLILSYLILS